MKRKKDFHPDTTWVYVVQHEWYNDQHIDSVWSSRYRAMRRLEQLKREGASEYVVTSFPLNEVWEYVRY